MAKINIGEILLSALVGPLESVVLTTLTTVLENMRVKNPEAHATTVVALYRPIKVHLAKLTDESKTKIDDAVVGGIIAAIELSAQAAGITLPAADEAEEEFNRGPEGKV